MNLDALIGKLVTIWMNTKGREISGIITAVAEHAIEIRCDQENGASTVWQVMLSEIAAVGCNQ